MALALATAAATLVSLSAGVVVSVAVSLLLSDRGSFLISVVFCWFASFFALALAIAAAICGFLAVVGASVVFACVSGVADVCAFLAFTRANAAATADFSLLPSTVPEFILALRASAAFLCFSSRAFLSRSNLNLRASNLTLAFSAFSSSCFCSRISALPIR